MKKTVCVLLIGALLFALAACSEESLIGTWTAVDGEMNGEFTFNEDGTGKLGINGISVDTAWSVNGKGLLTVKVSTTGAEYDALTDAEYEIKGDKLIIISDGKQIEMTRKK